MTSRNHFRTIYEKSDSGYSKNRLLSVGAQCRNRTCDLWLRRPTLYPTELTAREPAFLSLASCACQEIEMGAAFQRVYSRGCF